jgi:hypothetical protein
MDVRVYVCARVLSSGTALTALLLPDRKAYQRGAEAAQQDCELSSHHCVA